MPQPSDLNFDNKFRLTDFSLQLQRQIKCIVKCQVLNIMLITYFSNQDDTSWKILFLSRVYFVSAQSLIIILMFIAHIAKHTHLAKYM